MDERNERLREKLDGLLLEAAEVSVTLDQAEGTIRGVPHYSVIEQRAHELGRQLSCRIQAQHLRELVAAHNQVGQCPTCDTRCKLTANSRAVTSVDGKVALPELKGDCPNCRRSFFPDADPDGI